MKNNQLLSKMNSGSTNTENDDFSVIIRHSPLDSQPNEDNDVSDLEISPFCSDRQSTNSISVWHFYRRSVQEKQSTVAVAETYREQDHRSETMAGKTFKIPYSLDDTSSKLESLKSPNPLQIYHSYSVQEAEELAKLPMFQPTVRLTRCTGNLRDNALRLKPTKGTTERKVNKKPRRQQKGKKKQGK